MPRQTELASVLLAAGLKVAEVEGWQARGSKTFGPIRGIICHHTAGARTGNYPSLRIVRDGRPGLSGPLSQLGLGRDGTWYVIAAGRANHAGSGSWKGQTAGNTCFIGIEAENVGDGTDPWPEVQLEAYARGVAALALHYGLDVDMVIGHKEWAPSRKIDPAFDRDPSNADMDAFREGVRSIMDGEAPAPALIPEKDAEDRPTVRRMAYRATGTLRDYVEEIQRAAGVDDDGWFGSQTEKAVRALQRAAGLVADGIVGPKTWPVILKALA
ncbi:peptidoglycan recognition protein family protein [Acuticoccus sediminis]|uniref:peptidoglycan recognition protein family protein n=1 Tax=Acuticoccus sediminis TaxID=2184697 RepID=UPI001CFC8C76|nr:N-acetylmuramoyl-L-alanine amidase [Acuticoccus sediminis]